MTEAEFNQILDKYQSTVSYTIFSMVHSWEITRDLLQDTFIRLWNIRKEVREDKPVFNLLYRIAINLSIDHLRKTHPDSLDRDIEETVASDNPSASELYNLILHCARYLHPKQQAVFILRDIEGLDFQDIENILELPVRNLQSNLYLARNNIRRLLAEKFDIEKEFLYDM